MTKFLINNNEKIIQCFIKNLKDELYFPKISEVNYFVLRKYYYQWYKNFSLMRQYYYMERLKPLVKLISSHRAKHILDIGCGVGSEAILCALLESKVLGVDLSQERIECAKERKTYYERMIKRKLDLEFQTKNFFRLNLTDKFDLTWMNEVIHHIEPPLEALKRAYYFLKPNGYIVISDANAFNPFVQAELLLKRGFKFYHQIPDPGTGQMVLYGNEKVLTSGMVKAMLEKAGFRQINILWRGGFLPTTFIPTMVQEKYFQEIKKIEKFLVKLPIFRNFAKGYNILAQK